MVDLSDLQRDLTLNKEMLDLLNPNFQYANIRNFPLKTPTNTSALKLKNLTLEQRESSIEYFQSEVKRIQSEINTLQAPTFFHSQESGTGTLDIGQQPTITTPTPQPIVETPLVTEPEPVIIEQPIITATPIITPTVDDSINDNMVTQQVINFNIVNGRAVGSIKFVATNNFNSYYYGKDIINLVQFKTPNGVTLLVKQNRLRFTQTERD